MRRFIFVFSIKMIQCVAIHLYVFPPILKDNYTLKIFQERTFIINIIITFAINTLIHFIGEETIEKAIAGVPVLGILVSSIFGLIPNCAGSVIITELYLSNLISFGSMIAGLLVGSGIGILVLFKSNKNIKENLTITGLLMLVGIIVGLIIDFVI